MATLYKGAGPGTHWHVTDPRQLGFQSAAFVVNPPAAVRHITSYSHPSAFVSFTASFAIAFTYALAGVTQAATQANPGYIWEIDTSLAPCQLHDPVALISSAAAQWNNGPRLATHHDGEPSLILGIASPRAHGHELLATPRRAGGGPGPAAVQAELKALVYALRDAEVLAERVPPQCIVNRHLVY